MSSTKNHYNSHFPASTTRSLPVHPWRPLVPVWGLKRPGYQSSKTFRSHWKTCTNEFSYDVIIDGWLFGLVEQGWHRQCHFSLQKQFDALHVPVEDVVWTSTRSNNGSFHNCNTPCILLNLSCSSFSLVVPRPFFLSWLVLCWRDDPQPPIGGWYMPQQQLWTRQPRRLLALVCFQRGDQVYQIFSPWFRLLVSRNQEFS